MNIVQSKALIALSVFLVVLTIYSTSNMFEAGVSEGVPLLLVSIVTNILGAITAVMIFLGQRSAFKWFYAMLIGSLTAVPLVGMRAPEAPIWMLAVIFLLMTILGGVMWSVMWWRRDALNQPALGAQTNA